MFSPQFYSYLLSISVYKLQVAFSQDPPWWSFWAANSGEAEEWVEGCSSPWVRASLAEAAFYFWRSCDLTASIRFQREVASPLGEFLAFLGQRERGICTLRSIFRKSEPKRGQPWWDHCLSVLLWSLSLRCFLERLPLRSFLFVQWRRSLEFL